MNVAISLIRFFAILLIVNEHLELVWYPRMQLAIGGYLGNSLFFFVSGWGLTQSFARRPCGTLDWYWKRFFKLFVMLAIFIGLIHFPDVDKIVATLQFHLIPTPAKSIYFIPNILVLYAFSYCLVQLRSAHTKGVAAALLFVPVAVYAWLPQGRELITYTFPFNALLCFLLGALAAREDRVFENRIMRSGPASFVLLLAAVALHLFLRRSVHNEFYSFYVTIAETVFFYALVRTLCARFDLSAAGTFLHTAASSSLAAYLVHFSLIDYFWSQKMCGFIYVVKFMLITFALAIIMTQATLFVLNTLIPATCGFFRSASGKTA